MLQWWWEVQIWFSINLAPKAADGVVYPYFSLPSAESQSEFFLRTRGISSTSRQYRQGLANVARKLDIFSQYVSPYLIYIAYSAWCTLYLSALLFLKKRPT